MSAEAAHEVRAVTKHFRFCVGLKGVRWEPLRETPERDSHLENLFIPMPFRQYTNLVSPFILYPLPADFLFPQSNPPTKYGPAFGTWFFNYKTYSQSFKYYLPKGDSRIFTELQPSS